MTTKKELYKEAQLLNIRGRSTMNKEELEAAIKKAKKKKSKKPLQPRLARVKLKKTLKQLRADCNELGLVYDKEIFEPPHCRESKRKKKSAKPDKDDPVEIQWPRPDIVSSSLRIKGKKAMHADKNRKRSMPIKKPTLIINRELGDVPIYDVTIMNDDNPEPAIQWDDCNLSLNEKYSALIVMHHPSEVYGPPPNVAVVVFTKTAFKKIHKFLSDKNSDLRDFDKLDKETKRIFNKFLTLLWAPRKRNRKNQRKQGVRLQALPNR